MRDWWRWVLRGLAVVALVVSGILLVVRPNFGSGLPSARVSKTGVITVIPHQLVSFSCPSTLDQIQGKTRPSLTYWSSGQGAFVFVFEPNSESSSKGGGIYFKSGLPRSPTRACSAATTEREHVAETFGAGVVMLVGVSFLRRRRPMAIAPVGVAPV